MAEEGARNWYRDGVGRHYADHGADYANPHAPILNELLRRVARDWDLDLAHVLDLAAGAGEVTLALRGLGRQIDGIDPFTFEAYERATSQPCERLDFGQIAAGALRERSYSLIVCSFAMHLCPPSQMPQLAIELALISPGLMILTPHKRPTLSEKHGWRLEQEAIHRRVRARLYKSALVEDAREPI